MTDGKKGRILFFDLLRIAAIFLVVATHVLLYTGNWRSILVQAGPFSTTLGELGVSLFLLVSGGVLAYNTRAIAALGEYKDFILKRLLRIYPAYWYSLVFAILLNLLFYAAYRDFRLGGLTPWDYLLSFSGFQAFFGQWGGRINDVGWFIGVIVSLYLLYPLLSRAFDKHLFGTLAALLIISFTSRALIFFINPADPWQAARWFPTCNLFDFGLGIFLVKARFYPGTANKFRTTLLLSDLSFYVFLIHAPLLYLVKLNAAAYVLATLALAYVFYRIDGRIKNRFFSSGITRGLPQPQKPSSGTANTESISHSANVK